MHHKWPRRPILDPKDTEGMALCRLGEGANMIGYYMYHGGSQPLGVTGRLVEGGMPLVSYDYQAPLGEYGKTNASYYHLKRLHWFIQDFGQDLAPMVPSLPEERPQANDPTKLRYALRSKGKQGFLFFNNYQRYLDMPDRKNVQFAVVFDDEELVFPETPITIPSKSMGIFPINMPIADATLVYATAQPMMRWQDGDITRLVLVCLDGIDTYLCVSGVQEPRISGGQVQGKGDAWLIMPQCSSLIHLQTKEGKCIEVLLLSEQDGLNAYNFDLAGRRYLVICPMELWHNRSTLFLRTIQEEPGRIRFYPAISQTLSVDDKPLDSTTYKSESVFALSKLTLPQVTVTGEPIDQIPTADKDYPFKPAGPVKAYRIKVGDVDWSKVSDVMVRFEYIGDTARLYLNGLLVADNFWCKTNWDVWLKRWQKELAEPNAELILVISPWKKDQKVFVQRRPEVTEDLTAELFDVKAFTEKTLNIDVK
jgi:hypothetical protein